MKRILVFLGLKIAELSAIAIIPYGLGRGMEYLHPGYVRNFLELGTIRFWSTWRAGLFTLVFLTITIFVVTYISLFIKFNWDKATELTERY